MSNIAEVVDDKTHYRKAFNSPYLSAADITQPTMLKISHVQLEPDKTKKTKDHFNTAYFVEKEIRKGEALKPMVLNVTNCKILAGMTNSKFIDDWVDIPVTVYVDPNVRFGNQVMEGLRLKPGKARPVVAPENVDLWNRAKAAFERDKNLDAVKQHADISEEHEQQLIREVMGE
jgi:hypothetical protein